MADVNWPVLIGTLLFFTVLVWIFLIPFLRGRRQHKVQEYHWHVIEGGQQQRVYEEERGYEQQPQLEPPSIPQHPWLLWMAHFTWFQQWQYKHGWNKQESALARAGLKLFVEGLDDEFYTYLERRDEEQSGQVIEATIREVVDQPEVQEEQPLPSPGQWNLTSLKAEGYGAYYQVYALGMLPYLYNHLPQSGTIHRDDNKKEPGLVMGKAISQSQWDDFIGSSNPTAQKGQGLFRRAGLIVDIEREAGRKVTVFAHRDVGQAISILTQYLIQEQQGQTNKQKDEQGTPHQRREDEEEKSTEDTPQPLPQYQFQEYR